MKKREQKLPQIGFFRMHNTYAYGYTQRELYIEILNIDENFPSVLTYLCVECMPQKFNQLLCIVFGFSSFACKQNGCSDATW